MERSAIREGRLRGIGIFILKTASKFRRISAIHQVQMNWHDGERKGFSSFKHHLLFSFGAESLCYFGVYGLLFCLFAPAFAADRTARQTEANVKPLAMTGILAYDWSPDARAIVYVTREGVWKARGPHFDHPEQLVRKGRCMGAARETPQVLWSLDGQKFAFLDSRPVDEWSSIWVANADGSQVRELLPSWDFSYNSRRYLTLTEWVNNEELSVFFSCGPGCRALGVANAKAGQRPIRLGENPTGAADNIMAPRYVWSPSRRWVVAERNSGDLGLVDVNAAKTGQMVREAEDHRLLLPACGLPPANVPISTEEKRVNHFNSWSPDETRGLVTQWQCGQVPILDSQPQLALWHIQQQRTRLLVDNAGWGVWSPDGTKVAFLVFGIPQLDRQHRILGTIFRGHKPFQVSAAIMDFSTRRVSVIIPLGSFSTTKVAESDLERLLPVWSPTGTHLLLTDTHGQKLVARSDRNERQALTPSGDGATARWSPDGRWITIHVPRPDPEPDCYQKPVDTLVPPIGKENMAVSNDEMIRRYFVQRLLTEPELPESLPRYVTFLETDSQSTSSNKTAEQQRNDFCQGLSTVLESVTWRTRVVPVTIAEKYQHRCSKWHASEAPIDTKAAEDFLNAWIAKIPSRLAQKPPGAFVPSPETEAARQKEVELQEENREKTAPALPSLYLVEIKSEHSRTLRPKENSIKEN
ncbi:MAG: hypothetical protein FJ147_11750 [Deltaproteobacteria bacterium]|nr:hypothetical protein [Deltaproteobacteria bacterium]